MRVQCCALAAILLAVPMLGSATTYVIPTTTLAALTTNNTSAANGFTLQTNGNRGSGNVSKLTFTRFCTQERPRKSMPR